MGLIHRLAGVIGAASLVLVGCSPSGTDNAVAEAEPAPSPSRSGALSGRFLHLSDIHFDPFYDPSLLSKLDGADAKDWEGIFEGSAITTFSGHGADSNYPLMKATLQKAGSSASVDYVLYTGDFLAHHFVSSMQKNRHQITKPKEFAAKTVAFVNLMIGKYFPNTPLVAALGNNDSSCGDYLLSPGNDILGAVADDLPLVAADPNAAKTFEQGGWYTIPHPTVANHKFLVLSVVWARDYNDSCGTPSADPGAGQVSYLSNAVNSLGSDTASLLMHIPPGVDGYSGYSHNRHPNYHRQHAMWNTGDGYEKAFETAISGAKGAVIAGYAGHTHMDEFRALSSNGAPYLAVKMAPSVSPVNGNNPSFTVWTYDTTTAAPLDYTVTSMSNLSWSTNSADWDFGYTFSSLYGSGGYTPAKLSQLATSFSSDAKLRSAFADNYAAGASTPAEREPRFFVCALDQMNLADYNTCLNGWTGMGGGS